MRARTTGLSASDVDRALTEERSLLVTWLNRGTLHLVRSADYPWLHALTAPPLLKAVTGRLARLGASPGAADRGVDVVARSLAGEGPLTRLALRERLDAADVPTEGQALVHILMLASLRGLIVRGPMAGKEHAYALVRDWLPATRPVDRDAALAELARRYLAGHGPATDRDLARWAGLPLRDARAGLEAIASELVERDGGAVELRAAPAQVPAGPPPPRLLGAFEPVLLGWVSREPILGSQQGIVTINGIFRPFAMVRGRAVATWRIAAGAVQLEPFAPFSRRAAAALRADGDDVLRYLQS